MTGGTIIVRKGVRYVMTKVAHDGYDVEDHIGALKRFAASATTPEAVTTEYLRLRGGEDFEPFDPLGADEEKCRVVRDYADLPDAKEAVERMKAELNGDDVPDWDDEDPKMQLGCSYCDYFTFIDMDSGVVIINDEEV